MAVTSKVQFYLGTVVGIKNGGDLIGNDPSELLKKDSQFHECIIDIPGVAEGVLAFPRRGEIDEPKIGDLVFVTSLDPIYGSYYLFEKLQENDFVGFRAHGKMVNITHDAITIGVFDEKTEYKDGETPDCSGISHIIMKADGTVDIHTAGDVTINNDAGVTEEIGGNQSTHSKGDITIKSDSNITVEAASNVTVKGGSNIEVNAPQVKITGGQLTTDGSAAPSGSGPFCGIPACLFTGAPHIGNVVSGT